MEILITVDVEASSYKGTPLPFDKMVLGEFGGKYYGIQAIMEICEKYGAKGTFFVDVYEYANVGKTRLKQICNEIKNRGHSVELHTHPSRILDRMCMKDYSVNEQIDIIKQGKQLLKDWIGEDSIAHRAGSFGANNDTLIALRENDFKVDSSYFYSYPYCQLNFPQKNQLGEKEGILQVPPTLFQPLRLGPYKNTRNLDVDTCTLSELKHVIKKCQQNNIKAITILLHSSSFIKRNADSTVFWPDEADKERFNKMMEFIYNMPNTSFVTMKQIYRSYKQNPDKYAEDDYMPYSGIMRTFIRACKRWRDSKKNKIFLLTAFISALLMALLLFQLIKIML